jgi:hypothetical protein
VGSDINVTSLVSLLAARDPAILEELRKRFPKVAAIQPGLKVLGTPSEADMTAFKQLAVEVLRVSRDQIATIGKHLDSRLRWARRVRLGSSLVGGLASAGLLGAVLLEKRLAALIAAAVTFTSSGLAVIADFIENGLGGQAAGLSAIRLRAASVVGRIATLEGEAKLASAVSTPSAEWIAIVQRANAVAAEVRQIEFEAGLQG